MRKRNGDCTVLFIFCKRKTYKKKKRKGFIFQTQECWSVERWPVIPAVVETHETP